MELVFLSVVLSFFFFQIFLMKWHGAKRRKCFMTPITWPAVSFFTPDYQCGINTDVCTVLCVIYYRREEN